MYLPLTKSHVGPAALTDTITASIFSRQVMITVTRKNQECPQEQWLNAAWVLVGVRLKTPVACQLTTMESVLIGQRWVIATKTPGGCGKIVLLHAKPHVDRAGANSNT